MNIIFLLLKLIGIILLAVIALLLLIVLTVLFVPIRYTVRLEHGGNIYADCRVNWLLHFINARISYINEKPHIRIRLLFITLYDSLRPKKEKKARKLSKGGKQRGQVPQNKAKAKQSAEADKNTTNLPENKQYAGKKAEEADTADRNTADSAEILNSANTSAGDDNSNASSATDSGNSSNGANATDNGDSLNSATATDRDNSYDNASNSFKASSASTDKHKKKTIFTKAADLIRRLFAGVKAFFAGIRDKIIQLAAKASDLRAKLKLITDFLHDSANREGFSLTYSKVKSLLKHILPYKLKSTVRFGTGDPCTTGQALGAISILYSFYGDKISVTPDFENKLFEGKHYARGRIRAITILIIAFKLLRDERFKRLKTNFLLLKEAL